MRVEEWFAIWSRLFQLAAIPQIGGDPAAFWAAYKRETRACARETARFTFSFPTAVEQVRLSPKAEGERSLDDLRQRGRG